MRRCESNPLPWRIPEKKKTVKNITGDIKKKILGESTRAAVDIYAGASKRCAYLISPVGVGTLRTRNRVGASRWTGMSVNLRPLALLRVRHRVAS